MVVTKPHEIAEKIASTDGDTNLVSFALSLFDTIGLNQDDKGENALVRHLLNTW